MRLALWLYMLYPATILSSSPFSTSCDRRQRSKILFWNYFNLTSAEIIQSCKYIQLLANNFQPHQPTSNAIECFWNYFSLNYAEKAQSRKYIQILADPFLVSSKPFIWVGLLFGNYLILRKLSNPSESSTTRVKYKNPFFLKLIPTPHSKIVCVNESRGGICRGRKFPTYHKLIRHTTKSTKYSQLQSTTYCC